MIEAPTPLKLSLKRDRELVITWTDGVTTVYPISYLRARCPCAGCKALREQMSKSRLTVLPDAPSGPLSVVSAEMVGNYALHLHWSDNHDSGIYSFSYLREIGPPQNN